MNAEDMILISVDDHLVEPPRPVRRPHPGEVPGPGARRSCAPTTATTCGCSTARSIPNIGLNAVAGRPKEEYGIEPTAFDEMRPGCYDIDERVKDMNAGGVLGSMCFPSFPGFSGPAVRRSRRQGPRARRRAGLQRLAHRRVVRRLPRPLHPDGAARAVGRRARAPTRCAASRRRAATRSRSPRTPRTLGYPSFHDDALGPAVAGAVRRRDVVLSIHLGSSGQLAVTAPDAPIDVMITLQPMNICQAAADLLWSRVFKEFPDLTHRAVRGRHRLDPVLPRPPRPHLRHAPPVDRPGLRRPAAERGVPRALPHLLHRRPDRRQAARRHRHRQHRAGSATTRTPTRRGRTRPRSSPRSADRRARRRHRQDHARERDALVLASTRSPTAPSEQCTVGALRAEAAGHDVSIRALRQGPLRPSTVGIDLGELAENATA